MSVDPTLDDSERRRRLPKAGPVGAPNGRRRGLDLDRGMEQPVRHEMARLRLHYIGLSIISSFGAGGALAMPRLHGEASALAAPSASRGPTSDERDQIIAEYESVCQQRLTRADLVPSTAPFNTSDYKHWQRNQGNLPALFKSVLERYRGSEVVDAVGSPLLVNGHRVRIPAAAKLRVSSGWRNPRRNSAVGSVVGCSSRHLSGRALDLVPEVTPGELESGASTVLDIKAHLFPTLWAAAKGVGVAIAEAGSVPVPCGTFEDHVHVHRP